MEKINCDLTQENEGDFKTQIEAIQHQDLKADLGRVASQCAVSLNSEIMEDMVLNVKEQVSVKEASRRLLKFDIQHKHLQDLQVLNGYLVHSLIALEKEIESIT